MAKTRAKNRTPAIMRLDLNSPDVSIDMEPAPRRLYHYTDAAGFARIVASKSRLRATHHRFLNDGGEIDFGFSIALEVLKEMPGLSAPIRNLARRQMHERRAEDSFVACFSKQRNVLSQWRAYANNGAGYCIGFQVVERMEGYGDDNAFWSNHLFECLYGRRAVEKRLQDRFTRHIERFEGHRYSDRAEVLASNLSWVAWRYAQLAKHDHFREEREWRLVVGAPDRDVLFHVGRQGLTPYLPTRTLTIKEVWVGPGLRPSPEVGVEVAKRYLAKHEVTGKVGSWESPFRG